MKRQPCLITLLLTLLSSLTLFAGRVNTEDSLLQLLNENIHDTSKLHVYIQLSDVCGVQDIKDYAVPALDMANILLDNQTLNQKQILKRKAEALNNLGFMYNYNDHARALDYYKKALSIYDAIGDTGAMSLAFNNIGYIYGAIGDISTSLKYYDKSLKIRRRNGNKKGVASLLNNIGFIFWQQGEKVQALEYYMESLKLHKELKYNKGIAYSMGNVAYVYWQKGNLTKSLDYYYTSLGLYNQIGDEAGRALSLVNIASIKSHQGFYFDAEPLFNEALAIQIEMKDKKGQSESIIGLSTLYAHKGDAIKSVHYGEKALQVAKDVGYPELVKRAAQNLSQQYKIAGKFDKALENYQLFVSMKDSVQNSVTQRVAIEREISYKFEKKEALAKVELEKKDALTMVEHKEEEVVRNGLAAGLLLSFVAFFIVSKSLVTRKKINKELFTQKELVEDVNHKMVHSLTYARQIQEAILPSKEKMSKMFNEYFVYYQPKEIVSGDFYWCYEAPDGKKMWAAIDCTGHGVPGAFMCMTANTLLNKIIIEQGIHSPAEILNKLRSNIIETFKSEHGNTQNGLDIALCVWDPVLNKVEYAGANNALWMIRNGEYINLSNKKMTVIECDTVLNQRKSFISIKADPVSVSYMHGIRHKFTKEIIDVRKGDQIYIFSDGFADQFGGPKRKKVKVINFRSLLIETAHLPLKYQKMEIDSFFQVWKGQFEQLDDVCVMGVKIT